MKLSLQLAAIAVSGLLGSTALAQTANPPLTNATEGSGVVVSIWDTTTPLSLTAYLNIQHDDLATLGTTDFGILNGFSSTFGTNTDNLVFTVVSGHVGTNSTTNFSTTGPLSGSLGTGGIPNNGNVVTAIGVIDSYFGSVNAACPATAPCVSNSATSQNLAVFAGDTDWGSAVGGALTQASATSDVGSAIAFYNVRRTSIGATAAAAVTRYGSALAGFATWLVGNDGRVTYTLPTGGNVVPLPAAAWLLLSGLAGMITISRRKVAAAS